MSNQPEAPKPREWLVIESSMKHAVFASDKVRDQKGYIPRDVAENLLGRDLGSTAWFTAEDSAKLRAHPEWRDTEPQSSEAPKPETDFETWWRSLPDGPGYIGRHLAEYAWQAAQAALSARLAEVERERDERTDCLAREIEALRADVITAETALATAQGQLAEADAVINEFCKHPGREASEQMMEWQHEALMRHKASAAGKGAES